MLAKEPQHRYQSAQELLGELRRLHLEQSGHDLPEDLGGWEATVAELPADHRGELTRRLGRLMKTAAVQQPGRRRRLLLVLGVVVAFLLGGLIAWLATGEPPLPADAKAPLPRIPRQQTAVDELIGLDAPDLLRLLES